MSKIKYLIQKSLSSYSTQLICGIAFSSLALLTYVTLFGLSSWIIIASVGMVVSGVLFIVLEALAVVNVIINYFDRVFLYKQYFGIIINLRIELFNIISKSTHKYVTFLSKQDNFKQIFRDLELFDLFYHNFILQVLPAFIVSIFLSIFLLSYSFLLFKIFILSYFVFFAIIALIFFYGGMEDRKSIIENNSRISIRLSEHIEGIDELLVYDNALTYAHVFEETCDEVNSAKLRMNIIDCIIQGIVELMANMLMITFIVATFAIHMEDKIDPLNMALLIYVVYAFSESYINIPSAFRYLSYAFEAANRIWDIAEDDYLETSEDEIDLCELYKDCDFSLSFNDVCLNDEHGNAILNNISFEVKEREKMAIIGPVDSGKTAIVNLILKNNRPNSGEILICGKNIAAYSRKSIRNYFALLEQDPHIFSDTVRNNFLIVDENINDLEIIKACEKAGLSKFLASLPEGLNTLVGEGGIEVSNENIKRIGLARVFLKDFGCLILDSIDNDVNLNIENDLLSRVVNELKGRTLILLSHKNKDIDFMDIIKKM